MVGTMAKIDDSVKKKVPELRFKGFTDEWEERKFKDILKTHSFRSYLAGVSENGEYEVIQQGDKPIVGYSDGEPFTDYKDVTLFGDHTVSLYKPKSPFFVATDGVKILSADNFEGNYLYTTLERYKPEPQGYKRHFTILKNQDVWFTENMEEQQKIGSFFKQLDETIDLHQHKLDLLKEQKKGFLQKMFPKNGAKVPELRFAGFADDWEERKLGDLANIVRGASPRPIQDSKWFDKDSDIGWLRISDVTDQNGRIHHLEQRISKLGQEKTRVLKEPHLLLSIAATVGKPLVNYVKTGVHDGFLIFLNPSFEREFMFQWLEMFRPNWKKYGQPGSQVNLNSELVRNQEIPLPSIEEQQKIGSFFKQLDDTIALHQRKLDLLKEQKKGFLQKMFV
ncbi:restriction endonuclease subunit S [Lactococcus sp. EKM203L]|nr:restriction endonuclease subunit S [Lactococcus sp. EKM201L]KAF6610789.1 restriction endonuclease subunit S [Lactococcus sp. EKM203L]KAF6639902.1 restriction endonuclease subunit S [Lactococcus sp. EKM501L]KAF6641258.1 restriction endonuclease subunit S [Lactococcus sp. EKM502L]KAF6650534.1 restriction endonuclease subunit S [Lactococcus sp. EKM101L]KAF6667225.1 restriction endonuclease subunit S [Lactococcus sp. EKM102L]